MVINQTSANEPVFVGHRHRSTGVNMRLMFHGQSISQLRGDQGAWLALHSEPVRLNHARCPCVLAWALQRDPTSATPAAVHRERESFMAALKNPRHEQFAQLVASGKSATESYVCAGFSKQGAAASATRLHKTAKVSARIAELQLTVANAACIRASVDRQYVLNGLKTVVERCLQNEQVLDNRGKPTGQYTFQAAGANRGLELLGKELGMFVDRSDATHRFESPADVPTDILKLWREQALAKKRGPK